MRSLAAPSEAATTFQQAAGSLAPACGLCSSSPFSCVVSDSKPARAELCAFSVRGGSNDNYDMSHAGVKAHEKPLPRSRRCLTKHGGAVVYASRYSSPSLVVALAPTLAMTLTAGVGGRGRGGGVPEGGGRHQPAAGGAGHHPRRPGACHRPQHRPRQRRPRRGRQGVR